MHLTRFGRLGAGFGGSGGGASAVEPAPDWVMTGANRALDWANDRYYNADDRVFSRASVKHARDVNNELLQFASGVIARTDRGYFPELTRTIKNVNYNANPTDLTGLTKRGDAASTLTIVDDTTELTAAGLIGICTGGKAIKIDNSAGVAAAGVEFSGATGNNNAHRAVAYVRGTGTVGIGHNFGGSLTTPGTALNSTYTEIIGASSSGSSTRLTNVAVAAGSVAWIIFNRNEEGPYASSEIIAAGAGATRATDLLYLPATVDGSVGSVIITAEAPAAVTTTHMLFQLDNDTDNERLQIFLNGGNLRFQYVKGGSAVTTQTINALAAGAGEFSVGLSWNGDTYKYSWNGGATSTLGSQALRTGNFSHIRFGHGRTVEHWSGYIKRIDMFPTALA